MHVVRARRTRLLIARGNAKKEICRVVASLRNGSIGRAGGRVVQRRRKAVEAQCRLIRPVWYRIQVFLPEASAKLELMGLAYQGIVLLQAVELGELAARQDTCVRYSVVAKVR